MLLNEEYCLLVCYVPEQAASKLKEAVFAAGAGKLGDYEQCCWQTSGEGQFMPLAGSNPYLGSQDQLETVAELKLELLCPKNNLEAIISALRSSHPYETPAFYALPLLAV